MCIYIYTFYKGHSLYYEFQNHDSLENFKRDIINHYGLLSTLYLTNELDVLQNIFDDYFSVNGRANKNMAGEQEKLLIKLWGKDNYNENNLKWIANIIVLISRQFDDNICCFLNNGFSEEVSEEEMQLGYSSSIGDKKKQNRCPICDIKASKRCTKCHQGYCGEDHQKEHRPVHKSYCKLIENSIKELQEL